MPEEGSKWGSTPGRHGRPNSSISESSESWGDKRDPVIAPGGDIWCRNGSTLGPTPTWLRNISFSRNMPPELPPRYKIHIKKMLGEIYTFTEYIILYNWINSLQIKWPSFLYQPMFVNSNWIPNRKTKRFLQQPDLVFLSDYGYEINVFSYKSLLSKIIILE